MSFSSEVDNLGLFLVLLVLFTNSVDWFHGHSVIPLDYVYEMLLIKSENKTIYIPSRIFLLTTIESNFNAIVWHSPIDMMKISICFAVTVFNFFLAWD